LQEQFTKNIQKSLREISALYWVTRQINNTRDLTDIFRILVKTLDDFCNYNSVHLKLYDEDTGELEIELNEEKINSPDPSLVNEDVMDWILANRKIRVIPFTGSDNGQSEISMVVIPLISTDNIIGFIQIIMPIASGAFTPHLEQILWIICGQVAGAVQTARYLKKIERKNETLNEIQKYLTSVLDNMIHGIMVLNNKRQITLLSKSMEILFQITSKDVIGAHFKEIFPESIASILEHVISSVNKNGFVIDREFEHSFRGTKKIPISITASALEMGRKQSGIIFVIKDLSSSKKLIALAELDKLKSNFVATVSHEFKTPLNLILGSTNLLLEGLVGPLNEKQLRLLKLVKDGSERLMKLIKSLLNLAKIEAEKGQLHLSQISLKELINIELENFEQVAMEKQISLTFRIEDNLDYIIGDKEKLSQMIANLISNGIKYNNPGGFVKISVKEWEKDKSDRFVMICVKDNGIGIYPEDKDEIFNEFHRSNNPDIQQFEGSGLGLTIVKKIVDLHRGKIILQSHRGKGTEFKIILPRDLRIL